MAGLVLDDFLAEIRVFRKVFKLPKPNFGLKQIEREAGVTIALNQIIEATKKRHGSEICSKHDRLLEKLGAEIYAEEIRTAVYSGWRLSPSHLDRTLRKVFEGALQTLVQLPDHDPPMRRTKDRLVSLAAQFHKLAEKADPVLRTDGRIGAYFESTGESQRPRLLGLPRELHWGAEALKTAASHTRTVKLRTDSPNPQVRLAMYIAGWLEACTGRKHYERLRGLVEAAFAAADAERQPPKWIDRLEIEMNRKMKRRRLWGKSTSA